MALRYRRRRRYAIRGFISRAFRRYALAILFVMLGAFIMGVVSYTATLVPETTLSVGGTKISNKLFIEFIGWATGITFVLTGIKKFGIPI